MQVKSERERRLTAIIVGAVLFATLLPVISFAPIDKNKPIFLCFPAYNVMGDGGAYDQCVKEYEEKAALMEPRIEPAGFGIALFFSVPAAILAAIGAYSIVKPEPKQEKPEQ